MADIDAEDTEPDWTEDLDLEFLRRWTSRNEFTYVVEAPVGHSLDDLRPVVDEHGGSPVRGRP